MKNHRQTVPHWQDSINIYEHGYTITKYKFTGEWVYEVHLNGEKLTGVFEHHCQAVKWCKDKISMTPDYLLKN